MDYKHDGVTFGILLRRLISVALFIIILIIVSIDPSPLQVPGKADTTKTPSLQPPMKQSAPHSFKLLSRGILSMGSSLLKLIDIIWLCLQIALSHRLSDSVEWPHSAPRPPPDGSVPLY